MSNEDDVRITGEVASTDFSGEVARVVVENCPTDCAHETFHYCNAAGTHCDKHCVCDCEQCATERKNPGPVDQESGGRILPGSNVVE